VKAGFSGLDSHQTIPKDARERINLNVGDRILFVEENGKLVLKKG